MTMNLRITRINDRPLSCHITADGMKGLSKLQIRVLRCCLGSRTLSLSSMAAKWRISNSPKALVFGHEPSRILQAYLN